MITKVNKLKVGDFVELSNVIPQGKVFNFRVIAVNFSIFDAIVGKVELRLISNKIYHRNNIEHDRYKYSDLPSDNYYLFKVISSNNSIVVDEWANYEQEIKIGDTMLIALECNVNKL